MFKILRNQLGVSMVQVMIAAGMIGGLSLVLGELMKQQAQTKLTAELDTEINQIVDLLRKAINNKEMCSASFAGVGLGDNIEGIRLSQTSDKYFCKAREQFKKTKIHINSLRLLTKEEQEDPDYGASTFLINKDGTAEVIVEITLEKQGVAYGGKHIKKRFHFPAKFGEGEQMDVKLIGSDYEGAVNELQDMCLGKRANGDDDWCNVKDIQVSDIANQLKNSDPGVEFEDHPFYKALPDTIMLDCVVANPTSLIRECL